MRFLKKGFFHLRRHVSFFRFYITDTKIRKSSYAKPSFQKLSGFVLTPCVLGTRCVLTLQLGSLPPSPVVRVRETKNNKQISISFFIVS